MSTIELNHEVVRGWLEGIEGITVLGLKDINEHTPRDPSEFEAAIRYAQQTDLFTTYLDVYERFLFRQLFEAQDPTAGGHYDSSHLEWKVRREVGCETSHKAVLMDVYSKSTEPGQQEIPLLSFLFTSDS